MVGGKASDKYPECDPVRGRLEFLGGLLRGRRVEATQETGDLAGGAPPGIGENPRDVGVAHTGRDERIEDAGAGGAFRSVRNGVDEQVPQFVGGFGLLGSLAMDGLRRYRRASRANADA